MMKMLSSALNRETMLRIRSAFVLGIVFFSAFVVAHFLAAQISLPFSNPLGIASTLTKNHFNPANNLLRFAVITILPAAALAAIFFMPSYVIHILNELLDSIAPGIA